MTLSRTPEPEVMESAEEAADYDSMDHMEVNTAFVDDYLTFANDRMANAQDGRGLQILDLGTGTAQIPILLSSRLNVRHSILASDLSEQMLRVARRNIETAGYSKTVIPLLSNARRLPVSDRSVHHVLSNSIIHHIPDPTDVLTEVRRIVAPGGVVFFRDLLRPDTAAEVEHLVRQWAGEANAHQQQMFRESLHAAFTVAEMRDMLEATGFQASWIHQTTDRHWTAAGCVMD